MQHTTPQDIIQDAISTLVEQSTQITDGKWLETLTVNIAPYVKEWDLACCWYWSEWPEREIHFPHTTNQDVGIDAVAQRRSDNEYVAIQCKSRRLDDHGNGAPISKAETDKFASASSGTFWAERWIVTNGNAPLNNNAQQVLSMADKPIKMVDIAHDLRQQHDTFTEEDCPHCTSNPDGEPRRQTKTCMQTQAITESVRILKEHALSASGGLPIGQARGKIILPCGTGKTRISLRIIEELTPLGGLSIVLCPSIALVAQIRREYLQNALKDLRALAVCSDETAGYDPKKESARNTTVDPTIDNSNVSASEVKGKVTTNAVEIAQWIRDGQGVSQVSIIFGTYQSGRRISEALNETNTKACVLIADEAHRTAGLRRKRNRKNRALIDEEKRLRNFTLWDAGSLQPSSGLLTDEEERLRDFTLCHDNDAFPAMYRVYQTATPRIYDTRKQMQSGDWVVRTMDDETVFGVELYRKSYVEAVTNGWLADYRIIALGINDPEAYNQANHLAANTKSKGRRALTATDYLRGLAFALAMGGATQDREAGNVPIKSCIAFMNTVDKSKNMAQDLQSDTVRAWLQEWLHDNRQGQSATHYTLEHLDATYNVTARENAKRKLAESSADSPHGIINVGIFGEGTDSPTLHAVAFLEARKSPIDVIQAVGRAMRTAPGKERGYIICPILIPPNTDPEQWLSTSNMEEGWQELGQILLALRAHDQRIEDNLTDLLQLYVPQPPAAQRTLVAVARGEGKRIQYREHEGPPGEAQEAVERVLEGKSTLVREFDSISSMETLVLPTENEALPIDTEDTNTAKPRRSRHLEPTQIITGKENDDGSIELRIDTIVRSKPATDGTRGTVDIQKSKARAKAMINQGTGVRIKSKREKKQRRPRTVRDKQSAIQLLLLSDMEEYGNAIKMNLLSKSGLVDNRVARDLNILEASIQEATHHLKSDNLQQVLDRHFGLDNLQDSKRSKQADGCTIAALLMMNAAMLHQRIANGDWLSGVADLSTVKNATNVVNMTLRQWNAIMRHDFLPVLEPAVRAIEAIEDTGKLAGLERALRHIAAEAERIAEAYADMGADHAGPLFNKVMGNQASDGAFFTRPVAASLAARLTLDACGSQDWTNAQVWQEYKTVDPACGSGTLLAAMLTEMKHRAYTQGASETQIAALQKLAVEEILKGLDINPVSLQLAASQLTAGNQDIRYKQMGLHQMPYGPHPGGPTRVSAGTLELLSQKTLVSRNDELDLADEHIGSSSVWQTDDAELEDAVDAAKDARIVIMNPPFTNRTKMGEKFPQQTQRGLRSRVDAMEQLLIRNDQTLTGFVNKNALRPLFVALSDRCLHGTRGILTMINPTVALSSTSGLHARRILAQRYHIHTVLTCHQPGQGNMSQNTNINESLIVAKRHDGPKPPTQFINLDRWPMNDTEVADLHDCLARGMSGLIPNGWGEVSTWPTERIETGDWTPAIWRSPVLAEAAYRYAHHPDLYSIKATGLLP